MKKRFIFCLKEAIKKLQTSTKAWKTFTNKKLKSKAKKLIIFKKPPSPLSCHKQDEIQNAFSKVYVDDMFSENFISMQSKKGETSSAMAKEKEKKKMYSVDDAWKAVVASSPQLRGVDERANDFIYKFRQDMKLQKERSLLEFQAMLARGV